ncbi:MAG: hypothetical protein R2827_13445 [Bdellovibrionales bacterium]
MTEIEIHTSKDFFSMTPDRDTLIHRFSGGSPTRLLSDTTMQKGPVNEVIPYQFSNQNGRLVLIGQLAPSRYAADIGVSVIEVRLFSFRETSKAQLDRKYSLLSEFIGNLRENNAFKTEDSPHRIGALDGRLEHPTMDIWVAEHNAGVQISELYRLSEKPPTDPRHISALELELAEKSLADFRKLLSGVLQANSRMGELLDQLGYTADSIPERLFHLF